MTDVAIRVDGLGKRYRIGKRAEAYGTLRDTLASSLRAPFRGSPRSWRRNHAPQFWALRDISFTVKRGEVLGIVGRNGAGKSTLLKILSQVTPPSTGRAEIYGRVGSLLEVGTGFHPELTGRENIFLNGAILGMKRAEIRQRFDDIVEFAGIETFLDTPIKRFSSGMYMRLAFSVAAHLESEILIVDEVLAVGDAAFQRKCLSKMDSVARDGKTVLFVSHNMPAVQALCQRALLLDGGKFIDQGPPATVIQRYLQSELATTIIPLDQRADRSGDGSVRFESLEIASADETGSIRSTTRLKLTFGYRSTQPVRRPQFVVSIHDSMDIGLFVLHNDFVGGLPEVLPPEGRVVCITDPINLTPGRCVIHLELLQGNVRADHVPYAAHFDVEADDVYGSGMLPPRDWALCVLGHRWSFDEGLSSPDHDRDD